MTSTARLVELVEEHCEVPLEDVSANGSEVLLVPSAMDYYKMRLYCYMTEQQAISLIRQYNNEYCVVFGVVED